jgi:hypothetical protein
MRQAYHSQAYPKLYDLIQEYACACVISLSTNERHNARVMHYLRARQLSSLALSLCALYDVPLSFVVDRKGMR